MVASLCALGLQSAMWYISLDLATTVHTLHCEDVYLDVNGEDSSSPRCNCIREMHYSDTSDIDEYETCMYPCKTSIHAKIKFLLHKNSCLATLLMLACLGLL